MTELHRRLKTARPRSYDQVSGITKTRMQTSCSPPNLFFTDIGEGRELGEWVVDILRAEIA